MKISLFYKTFVQIHWKATRKNYINKDRFFDWNIFFILRSNTKYVFKIHVITAKDELPITYRYAVN